MNAIAPDSGSFRDPSGRVYRVGDRVFRTITEHASADFEFVRGTGLIDRLTDEGSVLGAQTVPSDILGEIGENALYVVEHPRLPMVSYPYEWPFPALKAAALLHLNVQLQALDAGVTLSDASAYNVQFLGARPVFIDLLSFRRYRDGEIWAGHRQFCEQFLNPLLLRAKLGVAHNPWYRGSQEGISASDLRRLLPWTSKFSRNILLHVVAQSALQKSASGSLNKGTLKTAHLPITSYRRMLSKMREWVEGLEPADSGRTVWQNYVQSHSYDRDEMAAKKDFIAKFANTVKPGLLWDLGCNTGDYSKVVLENGGRYSVGFDFDHGALELAFARAAEETLDFQPLFLDGANPAPNQGWNECERKGLTARAEADAIIALAFVHHIAIGRNVPLDDVIDWLMSLAPQGIIEFVPKQDPMVQELLALRDDIFVDYTEAHFIDCLSRRSEIVESRTVTETGRNLVWYRRL